MSKNDIQQCLSTLYTSLIRARPRNTPSFLLQSPPAPTSHSNSYSSSLSSSPTTTSSTAQSSWRKSSCSWQTECIDALTRLRQVLATSKECSDDLKKNVIESCTWCMSVIATCPINSKQQQRYQKGSQFSTDIKDNDNHQGLVAIWNLVTACIRHLIHTSSRQTLRNIILPNVLDPMSKILLYMKQNYKQNNAKKNKKKNENDGYDDYDKEDQIIIMAAPTNHILLLKCIMILQPLAEKLVIIKPSIQMREQIATLVLDTLWWILVQLLRLRTSSSDAAVVHRQSLLVSYLKCIKAIAEHAPNQFHSYWFTFFSDAHYPNNLNNDKPDFFTLVPHLSPSTSSESFTIFTDVLSILFSSSSAYLAMADSSSLSSLISSSSSVARHRQMAFTPLSVRLGSSVEMIHDNFTALLTKYSSYDDPSYYNLTMRAFLYLCKVTQYQRLSKPVLTPLCDILLLVILRERIDFSISYTLNVTLLVLAEMITKIQSDSKNSPSERSKIALVNYIMKTTSSSSLNGPSRHMLKKVKEKKMTDDKDGNDNDERSLECLYCGFSGFYLFVSSCAGWLRDDEILQTFRFVLSRVPITIDEHVSTCLVTLITCSLGRKLSKNDNVSLSGDLKSVLNATVTTALSEIHLIGVCQVLTDISPQFWQLYPEENALWPIELCIQIVETDISPPSNSTARMTTAYRTLGALAKQPYFLTVDGGLETIFNALRHQCQEEKSDTLCIDQACWAFANLCDTIWQRIKEQDNHQFTNNLCQANHFSRMVGFSVYLISTITSEQARVSGMRSLGSLLSCVPTEKAILPISFVSCLQVLQKWLSEGSAKIRWNSGTALSNCLKNTTLLASIKAEDQDMFKKNMEHLVEALLKSILKDKNIKVRTSAVAALSEITPTIIGYDGINKVCDILSAAKDTLEKEKETLGWKEAGHSDALSIQIEKARELFARSSM